MKNTLSNLKLKSRSTSFKAAALSLTFHALLVFFAGSIVAVHYIQKQNAEFTVSTASPKQERRQTAKAKPEPPREMIRPTKIVSRSVSVSAPTFTAPTVAAPDNKPKHASSQKFSLPAAQAGRDVEAISGRFGGGTPQINFFGISTEGEKFVFVIDASAGMLTPETGGLPAYNYIKDTLCQTITKLPAAVLYNVILYDGGKISLFRPQPVPATKGNNAALSKWIQAVNQDSSAAGLANEQDNYRRPEPYPTAVGSDSAGWLLSLQAAFEQRPDNVFILTSDWGKHNISPAKQRLLRDFSLWELLSGGGAASVGGSSILRDDRKLRDDLLKRAVETIQKQADSRKNAGLPGEFLHDIPAYIEYPADQILDHAEGVYRTQYMPYQLERPRVHVVRLLSEGSNSNSDYFMTYMRNLVRRYNGEFEAFSGRQSASSVNGLQESVADQTADMTQNPEAPVSPVKFLGANADGSRIAFILDASAGMLSVKTGGTNTYALIKDCIIKAVAELQPGTLFNVIAYDRKQVTQFRSQMAPVSQSRELADWLKNLNSSVARSGLRPEQNNYTPTNVYDTAIGADVQSLPYAVQAAMEEQADAIFIVSTGIGPQPVSPEKAARLLDFSIWNSLGGSSGNVGEEDENGNPVITGTAATSGGKLQSLQQDKKLAAALLKQTLDRIAAEKKARQEAGLSSNFVPDILNSIEYPRGQIMSHIATVCKLNYVSQGLTVPVMNFICLQEAGKTPIREVPRELTGLTKPYSGTALFFKGPDAGK
ncbi:MAG: hypothetical protein HOO88_02775 [Kiritimatiellaceae bacterium]|nr:hypothetical protein [Kiritimatiellaceae bacterium]